MKSIFVGFVLLIFSGLGVVRPDILMRFQIWSQRVVMGARYEPGPRTYLITRLIGAVLMVVGLLAITGMIE